MAATDHHHPHRHPHDDARATAWSAQLAAAHDLLRQQLQDVRAGLGATTPAPDLFTHCLAFCRALDRHHVGEDAGLFAELQQTRPDLEPVIAALVQDHRAIAGILAAVRDLTAEAAGTSDTSRRAAIGRELDGLTAIVESHFRYEERAIGAALDAVGAAGAAHGDGTDAVFHPSA